MTNTNANTKWIIDRAQQYADLCGSTVEKIITAWEKDRSYWYMNYYQECNQPDLKNKKVIRVADWEKELISRFGNGPNNFAFVCPRCGNIQTPQDFIDNGIIDNPVIKAYSNCIGRYVKNKGCNWSLGGLLQINTLTVITEDGVPIPVFEMAPAPKNDSQTNQ